MFQNLLVPLDGSKFGELALPYAASLASQYQSKITLLHVVPSNWDAELRAERPESEHATQDIEVHDTFIYKYSENC